jgi:type II secretory pathway component PulF
VGKAPPANDVKLRVGDRDNPPDEIENNSGPQCVQIAGYISRQYTNCPPFCEACAFGATERADFRILDFELLSRPMPQFTYRARNAEGTLVEGVLECADRAIAIRQIEEKRCIPIKIEVVNARAETVEKSKTAKPAVTTGPSAPIESLKIPHGQLLIFTEQLAHLLQAGMTLDEGLSILEKRLKQPRVQQMTRSLHQALIDGRSFSQALREMPRIFPPLYVNLVAAGEASGALPEILLRLVKHLMQAKNLRDRVQQALIYPLFLAFAGAGLITVFITYMVPQLTGFMTQIGGALPLPTRILMQINHTIVTYWWLAALIAIGTVVGFRAFVRTDEGRLTWDQFRLKIPGYGRVIRHRYYAQFSRTLGTLMQNGIPLLRSLDLVSEIAGNKYLEVKLIEAQRAVVDGATLSAALSSQHIFPDLFTDMMAVGEQTGRFGETMQTIADVYERELDRNVAIISQLIPPVIIVIIATVVGLVVYSILSAVFEATHSLQFRPH